nr:hypothetical protein CFP56_69476 [Quercus suber]
MKTRPDAWANWLPGQSVETYCDNQIMPMGSEIDSVSLQALKNVLLEPAGRESSSVSLLAISLTMNRSGHYDILYKAEEPPISRTPVQTFVQYASHTHQEPAHDIGAMDFMTAIPGMSYAPQPNGWSESTYSSSNFFSSPGPGQHVKECSASPTIQPQDVSHLPSLPRHSRQLSMPPNQLTQELVMRPARHVGTTYEASLLPRHSVHESSFRPSAWELEGDFLSAQSQLPFTTSIFRNSHFNTAHFLNPEFQPEEWRPDDDYITSSIRSAHYRSEE